MPLPRFVLLVTGPPVQIGVVDVFSFERFAFVDQRGLPETARPR